VFSSQGVGQLWHSQPDLGEIICDERGRYVKIIKLSRRDCDDGWVNSTEYVKLESEQ
jgi:hypothetical protein